MLTSLCKEDSTHTTTEKEQLQDPSTLKNGENAISTKGEAKEEQPVDSTSRHSLGCAKLMAG